MLLLSDYEAVNLAVLLTASMHISSPSNRLATNLVILFLVY